MSQEVVKAFAEAYRASERAFNGGNFETAFAGLAPDVEWHTPRTALGGGVLMGREAVIRYFVGIREAGDWRVEALEFTDAGEGRVLVHLRGHAMFRTTKIPATRDFFQVWELGADGLVACVRDYESREEAFKAVGLRDEAMPQENVEIVRRWIEAFNRRDMAAIRAVTHPQVEWIEDPRYPGAQTFHGPDGVEQSVRTWWEAWEIELEPDDFIDRGDQVVVTGHGHYRGHGSDVTLTAEFATVYEVRDHKIVRAQVLENRRAALQAVRLRE